MKRLIHFAGALPFFCAVFLNAFVDLGHKIVIQNTVFKLYDGHTQVILTAVVNGLILLPFILMLSPAGYLSDRYAKPRVMQLAAWIAVFLCAAITAFYYLGWFELAFAMTFLLAVQSAIYSPAKMGFIKELFGKGRLGEANGIVSALSIIAILTGIFVFSILFEWAYPQNEPVESGQVLQAIAPIGWVLLGSAILELVLMYRLPRLPAAMPSAPRLDVSRWLTGRLFADDLAPLRQNRIIRLSVVGLATFWSVGQVMLATFPAFIKGVTGETNTIWVQGVLACSGIGIAMGSMMAGKISKDHIEIGLLPIAAIGLAAGLLFLPTISSLSAAAMTFLWIGFMGGAFIVPLNALIQFNADSRAVGKVLAANNWVQNVSMLGFLILTALFSYFGWSSKALLHVIALVALVGGIYTIFELPQSLTRFILSSVLSRRYKVVVHGLRNIPSKGGVLLLGNHVSWIDWAILQIASPRPIRFVMIRHIYSRWYLKWFFDLFGCIPIDHGARSREALKSVSQKLNGGEVVCLFPEGAISRTGHLASFRKGFERACVEVDDSVVIVPFYLRGLWGSQFSRSSLELRKRHAVGLSRDIVVAFGPSMAKTATSEEVKQRVLDVSITSWEEYVSNLPTISQQWIKSAKQFSGKVLIRDSLGVELSGVRALTASALMAQKIRKLTRKSAIGVLLPTTAGAMICNMASILAGKTLVNLNYTAGVTAVASAVEQAHIDVVITSEKFLRKLETRGIDLSGLREKVQLILVEDLAASMHFSAKVSMAIMCKVLPAFILKPLLCSRQKPEDIAAIVFSSGSEGAPKGIMLSHQNIMANVKQVSDVLNMEDGDVMLSNLPLFHAFGMTAAQFLPLLEGIPVVAHPDPTDVFGSAKLIATYQATIMFGTTTFLRMYIRNKKIHPLMLKSLRLIVAGAEKLQPDVRDQFKLKFNKDIYEGYGATETTPVAAVNLPDRVDMQDWKVQQGSKAGSVGMPLPGSNCRIVDPKSLKPLPVGESGMILIGGQQVMQGYLNNAEKTKEVIVERDGVRWYITGDKGHIDADGFLFIEDRYSRFAKIGGEMIPLSQLEVVLSTLLTESANGEVAELVAVNLPDNVKGEKIILLTTAALDKNAVRACLSESGMSSLSNPAQIIVVDAIPKLGSGKTDFASAKVVAMQEVGYA